LGGSRPTMERIHDESFINMKSSATTIETSIETGMYKYSLCKLGTKRPRRSYGGEKLLPKLGFESPNFCMRRDRHRFSDLDQLSEKTPKN
jgi:hypothetical protein